MTILEEYESVCTQLTQVQAAIAINLSSKNRKYEYSSPEVKHLAELQSLSELTDREKFLITRKANLESQLRCSFTQFKNR